MTDREKLIAIMAQGCQKSTEENGVPCCAESFCKDNQKSCYGAVADHLLANGVVVREKGEWGNPVKVDAEHNGYKCSKCGEFGAPCWHFCPNCGAKMEG